jgi:hypothetical protein
MINALSFWGKFCFDQAGKFKGTLVIVCVWGESI